MHLEIKNYNTELTFLFYIQIVEVHSFTRSQSIRFVLEIFLLDDIVPINSIGVFP
jgi:hypothetical protein